MEGLWGTAIRLAVRDPSSPQAPLFAEYGGTLGAKGWFLQAAQDTTTFTLMAAHPRCRGVSRCAPSGRWRRDQVSSGGSSPLEYQQFQHQ